MTLSVQILLFTNALSVSALIVHLFLSRRERIDLYNRIMSRTPEEYLRMTNNESKQNTTAESAHKRAIRAFHAKGTGISAQG